MADKRTIIVQGNEVTVPQPYDEGHSLTAVEAKVLNQTFAENIRNNTAKYFKTIGEENGPADLDEATGMAIAYGKEYQFTEAAAGGSRASLTPEEKEARKIAREAIRAQLVAAGRKMGDVDKEALAAAIIEVSQRDNIVKLAKKRVAETQKAAEDALAGLDLSAAA